jgi:large subunit ribosomal protein L30e
MVAASKKSKKSHESINSRLALVMKSGKYTLGYKTTLKTLRNGKVRRLQVSAGVLTCSDGSGRNWSLVVK